MCETKGLQSAAGTWVICNPCQDFLRSVSGQDIVTKIDFLKTSLLGDELSEKIYVTSSFLFWVRMMKPWAISVKIEVSDGVDVWAKKAFKNELTDFLFFISIVTKLCHV